MYTPKYAHVYNITATAQTALSEWDCKTERRRTVRLVCAQGAKRSAQLKREDDGDDAMLRHNHQRRLDDVPQHDHCVYVGAAFRVFVYVR